MMEPLQSKSYRPGKAVRAGGAVVAGVTEFSQLALWMAAVLAGMVSSTLVSKIPMVRALLCRLGHGKANEPAWRRAGSRPTRQQALPMLADAIVGNSKSAVAAVFGPPRSALVRGLALAGAKGPAFMQADTWYYPMPKNECLAMAIEFDDDSARNVEFFRAPNV